MELKSEKAVPYATLRKIQSSLRSLYDKTRLGDVFDPKQNKTLGNDTREDALVRKEKKEKMLEVIRADKGRFSVLLTTGNQQEYRENIFNATLGAVEGEDFIGNQYPVTNPDAQYLQGDWMGGAALSIIKKLASQDKVDFSSIESFSFGYIRDEKKYDKPQDKYGALGIAYADELNEDGSIKKRHLIVTVGQGTTAGPDSHKVFTWLSPETFELQEIPIDANNGETSDSSFDLAEEVETALGSEAAAALIKGVFTKRGINEVAFKKLMSRSQNYVLDNREERERLFYQYIMDIANITFDSNQDESIEKIVNHYIDKTRTDFNFFEAESYLANIDAMINEVKKVAPQQQKQLQLLSDIAKFELKNSFRSNPEVDNQIIASMRSKYFNPELSTEELPTYDDLIKIQKKSKLQTSFNENYEIAKKTKKYDEIKKFVDSPLFLKNITENWEKLVAHLNNEFKEVETKDPLDIQRLEVLKDAMQQAASPSSPYSEPSLKQFQNLFKNTEFDKYRSEATIFLNTLEYANSIYDLSTQSKSLNLYSIKKDKKPAVIASVESASKAIIANINTLAGDAPSLLTLAPYIKILRTCKDLLANPFKANDLALLQDMQNEATDKNLAKNLENFANVVLDLAALKMSNTNISISTQIQHLNAVKPAEKPFSAIAAELKDELLSFAGEAQRAEDKVTRSQGLVKKFREREAKVYSSAKDVLSLSISLLRSPATPEAVNDLSSYLESNPVMPKELKKNMEQYVELFKYKQAVKVLTDKANDIKTKFGQTHLAGCAQDLIKSIDDMIGSDPKHYDRKLLQGHTKALQTCSEFLNDTQNATKLQNIGDLAKQYATLPGVKSKKVAGWLTMFAGICLATVGAIFSPLGFGIPIAAVGGALVLASGRYLMKLAEEERKQSIISSKFTSFKDAAQWVNPPRQPNPEEKNEQSTSASPQEEKEQFEKEIEVTSTDESSSSEDDSLSMH